MQFLLSDILQRNKNVRYQQKKTSNTPIRRCNGQRACMKVGISWDRSTIGRKSKTMKLILANIVKE